jgi:hypothetical protein
LLTEEGLTAPDQATYLKLALRADLQLQHVVAGRSEVQYDGVHAARGPLATRTHGRDVNCLSGDPKIRPYPLEQARSAGLHAVLRSQKFRLDASVN